MKISLPVLLRVMYYELKALMDYELIRCKLLKKYSIALRNSTGYFCC